MIQTKLKGMGVALITPFKEDESVDYDALMRMVDYLLQNNADFLCVLGTTAETPTLTEEEKKTIKKMVIDRVNGRIPILLGVGGNNTRAIVETLKNDDFTGVDAILSVVPYYNKPSQEGIYQHYKAIAEATELPIVLYNVPGRTASNISPAIVARLAADFENIVAIKEAAGNVAQVAELYSVLPEEFTIYSGDDGLILPFMSVGATGLISVLSNIGGGILQDVMQAYEDGRVREAAKLNARMVPLANAMFIETNPIPVKAAVTLVTGIDAGQPRLPLTPMEPANKAKMVAVLQEYGLVK